MDFNSFPAEIQFQIFDYLTPFELQHFVAPICTRWHKIASLPYFWKKLTFDGKKHSSQQILRTFRRSPFVRKVKFLEIDDFDWTRSFEKFETVTILSIETCNVTGSIMKELVRLFPNIREIRISFDNSINDRSIVYEIAQLKSIRLINLFTLHSTDGNEFLELFTTSCDNLIHLYMGWLTNIMERTLMAFIRSKGMNLRTLALTGLENVTDVGYKGVLNCPYLEVLKLCDVTNMTDLNLADFEKLEYLRSLILYHGKKLFSDNFSRVFKNVIFTKLEQLTICDCQNLDNRSLRVMIESCPFLKYLHLYDLKNLDNEGLEHTASVCRYLLHLKLINVDNITKNCLTNLPIRLPYIESICADCCSSVLEGSILFLDFT